MSKLIFGLLVFGLLTGVVLASVALAEGTPLHYLEESISRYEDYQTTNPDMPFDLVVALINANVDKGPYTDIETVSDPSFIGLLLNKSFAIPRSYVPDDLIRLPGGGQLRREAAEAFAEMRDVARNAGLNLAVRSSYRTHGSQIGSYNIVLNDYGREAAERNVARAGHSEHQLGLALDILHISGTTGPITSVRFERTNEYTWLLEHGHEFGFILRYPQDTINIHGFVYEPWHWRYVGVEIASKMYEEGIGTLEEYYGRYLAPGVRAKLFPPRMTHPTILISEW